VFLFEDLPAGDQRTDRVYLKKVDRCDIYVELFGNEYGFEDIEDLSPTEREFDRATEQGKYSLKETMRAGISSCWKRDKMETMGSFPVNQRQKERKAQYFEAVRTLSCIGAENLKTARLYNPQPTDNKQEINRQT